MNATLSDDGMYECQVNTEPKINYKTFLSVKGKSILVHILIYRPYMANVSDHVKSPHADSPYYEVVDHDTAAGFEQTHSVIKKHHKELDKEGETILISTNIVINTIAQVSPCSFMTMAVSVLNHSSNRIHPDRVTRE